MRCLTTCITIHRAPEMAVPIVLCPTPGQSTGVSGVFSLSCVGYRRMFLASAAYSYVRILVEIQRRLKLAIVSYERNRHALLCASFGRGSVGSQTRNGLALAERARYSVPYPYYCFRCTYSFILSSYNEDGVDFLNS